MAVGINIERGGAEIAWDPGDYVGPVTIKAVNAENGDVGIVHDENDGHHFLTWPVGSWTDHITVFEGDTRVDPLHVRKMAAALQHATTGSGPVLVRRETGVGHSARAVSRTVDLNADVLAFFDLHLKKGTLS